MDKLRCNFSWIAIKTLDYDYLFSQNNLFSIENNKGVFKKVSDNFEANYLLFNLIPKAEFYHAIHSLFKKELNTQFGQKKPPFAVFIPNLNEDITFSFSIKFSPPNILILVVKLSEFSIELSELSSITITENFQKIFSQIHYFSIWTICLAEKLNKNISFSTDSIKYKPIIHVDCPCTSSGFQNYFINNKKYFLATLIRSRNTNLSNKMMDEILQKNDFHNQKSLSEIVLIDKQSILYLTPSKENKSNLWYRLFIEVFKLYEIALIFQELILSRFWLRNQNEQILQCFLYSINKWANKPKIIFTKSVTFLKFWKILLDEFRLKNLFDEILINETPLGYYSNKLDNSCTSTKESIVSSYISFGILKSVVDDACCHKQELYEGNHILGHGNLNIAGKIQGLDNMTVILIATATDLESKKLFSIAQENGITPTNKFCKTFSAVSLGVVRNCDIYFVQSQMGSGGPGGSALTINDAIEQLKPDFVLSIGVAFGSNPKKQKIGDVIVSSIVRCYEPERVGSNKIIPRGDRIPSSPTLVNRCNTAKLTWEKSDIHTGLLLSGEKLVDNQKFKLKLLDLEPEAVGGEMEGSGISAACYRKNIPWLIIKGICDWAENKDSKDQDLASENAFRFFWHILTEGGWSNTH